MVSKNKPKTSFVQNQTEESDSDDTKYKRPVSVSQHAVIKSIFESSLLNPLVKTNFTGDLLEVYEKMMADVSYINEKLLAKDYKYYNCRLGFKGVEKMIYDKRKMLVEVIENQMKVDEQKRIITVKHKKKYNQKIIHINSNDAQPKRQSKRKQKSPQKVIKVEQLEEKKPKLIDEPASEVDRKPNDSELKEDLIDLISDNSNKMDSSDSSDTDTACYSPSLPFSDYDDRFDRRIHGKMKIFSRESTKLKLPKTTKELTVIDRLLLGINCTRQWTEIGLQLTRLTEKDLVLLNKRLSSISSPMRLSDLKEHTDENNNKHLSIVLQSELFGRYLKSSTSNNDWKSESEHPRETLEQQQYITNNGRMKLSSSSKHIPAMYRQRHAIPSILSKPLLKSVPEPVQQVRNMPAMTFSDQPTTNRIDEPETIIDLKCSGENETPYQQITSSSGDPGMSASQLLKLKSQTSKLINTNNQSNEEKIPAQSFIKEPLRSQPVQISTVSVTNGFIQTPIFYQSVPNRGTTTPIIIPVRNRFIPISKGASSAKYITKLHALPLKTDTVNVVSAAVVNKQSSYPSAPSPTSQSVILKNLLQQSNPHLISPETNRQKMMSLSAFQSSKTKWQLGSVQQQYFRK